MKLFWFESSNFGDALNPWLIKQITGEYPEFSYDPDESKTILSSSLHGLMNYPAAKDGWVSCDGFPSPFEQLDFRANRLPVSF